MTGHSDKRDRAALAFNLFDQWLERNDNLIGLTVGAALIGGLLVDLMGLKVVCGTYLFLTLVGIGLRLSRWQLRRRESAIYDQENEQ